MPIQFTGEKRKKNLLPLIHRCFSTTKLFVAFFEPANSSLINQNLLNLCGVIFTQKNILYTKISSIHVPKCIQKLANLPQIC